LRSNFDLDALVRSTKGTFVEGNEATFLDSSIDGFLGAGTAGNEEVGHGGL
jgi:NADH:ubiquinone oxidoreductase subunit F (NADH-binding)